MLFLTIMMNLLTQESHPEIFSSVCIIGADLSASADVSSNRNSHMIQNMNRPLNITPQTNTLSQANLPSSVLPLTPMPSGPKALLAIDVHSLNFGACSFGSRRKVDTIPAQTVTVVNNR